MAEKGSPNLFSPLELQSPICSSPEDFEYLDLDALIRRRDQRKALKRPLPILRESIAKQTDFSLSLAEHVISTKAKDTNFVFSPLSMHVVLCMVASGSSGPTRDQFLGYLKSKSVEELNSLSSQVATLLFADGGPLGGPRLSFADGVWVDQSLTLKPAFKEIVENEYKAASNQVDFQNKADEVREEVNAWAEKETNGLIKDLLPFGSVDSTTKLILANALYFKGTWAEKFKKSLTKDDDFFLSNGTSVRVPFMTSRKKQCIHSFKGFKVLKLPYEHGDDNRRFSMLIYLPNARDGLPALVEKFGSVPGFIQNHLPGWPVKVGDFRVPKFKISFGFEASEVLQGQGLVLPFLPGGLNEMVEKGGERLKISNFFHKSCIDVDEQGTEAAAASACLFGECDSMGPIKEVKVDFVADHPFMFVVREDVSGAVLFVGQLLNPKAA
ncbi:serpin-zx [Phtheirospermum japonicum]|uniref:Serpin-zx n=1 Tax=Phtheirospermum japonicum TaxID=374723 RepID=A0A830AX43_9LAMI|nr:serpin-zx [Phtheirospermum japonicum]